MTEGDGVRLTSAITLDTAFGRLFAMAVFILLLAAPLRSQGVIASGEWKMFRQEHPPLEYVQLKEPIVVQKLKGNIRTVDGRPIAGAYFELGVKNGAVLGTDTDSNGHFEVLLPHDPLGGLTHPRLHSVIKESTPHAGGYRFKATKDGFRSTVGTIIFSRSAQKDSSIEIQLQSGVGQPDSK
jgi:hypothetical protein